ncbi:SDR family NAD(P)-dependent oxidoreductase [Streptomyces fuscigenes]|uniref:SDR family NAD(P)-dependent oxidoreductase n=1 Tax=Streptomyces fuscigenes TaxID=1528880 RepID=UPI001F3564E5|nr:SDR family NAD(P)-dependent oxidoreductase [Streptomyces fuscigenes]MCF3961051.1 SDR family NAD(P)-dependent oxidoreductase [Streptomyces fuscigenes]
MARVLITGASRGIGRDAATALHEQGHEVIATARDVSSLDDLPVALKLRLDVTDQDSVDRALAEAGRVDVLLSNAGATVRAPIETIPLDALAELFELNAFGALRVAQGVLPQMRRRGTGQLIFMSSIQGRLVIPLIGAYGATKQALEALAEALAIEAGRFGVSVHVVQPPAVSSGGAERAQVHLDDSSPYLPLLGKLGPFRAEPVSVREVADVVAATIAEGRGAPFRIPVGESARAVLDARKAAPDHTPFLAAPLDW